ncbi:chorismate-binding protein [Lentzea flava]|uniref:chorismate-binding protein n=1 Tax=Lentzea flava TaxID=103732 RepID=UPI001E3EDA88|nr:chorismate-binding protein [Lentzea flava]
MAELCGRSSVVVEDFMSIKERGTVQHLASSVSAQPPKEVGPWQALAALFPAATASGVPKKGCLSDDHGT